MSSRVTVTFPDYAVRVQLEIVNGSRPSYRGKIIADGEEPIPFEQLRLSEFRGFVGYEPNDWRDTAVNALAFMSDRYPSRLEYAGMIVSDHESRSGHRVRYRIRPRK